MKSFLPVLVVVFLVATIVMPLTRPTVSASPKATAEMLKQLEGEFMKAAADKGSQGYMSYYADDAVEVPNGAPLIQGKVEIAKGMGFLDDKNNRLIWTPVGAACRPRARTASFCHPSGCRATHPPPTIPATSCS